MNDIEWWKVWAGLLLEEVNITSTLLAAHGFKSTRAAEAHELLRDMPHAPVVANELLAAWRRGELER